MPANSAFKITIPATVSLENPLSTCTISHIGSDYPMTCTISGSEISLNTGFTASVSAGDEIKILIGDITNPSI